MLNCYVPTANGLVREAPAGNRIPEAALWLDLLEPTLEEEKAVEHVIGVDVPTREEMREIEASSRLYEEAGALFLTLTIVANIDTGRPETSAITFILAKDRLVTLRYADPLPFRKFIAYAERHAAVCAGAPVLLGGLLEAIVERIADVLERIGGDLDEMSAGVFTRPQPARKADGVNRDLRALMERIGRGGDLLSKARESLVSLSRLLTFVQQSSLAPASQDLRGRYRNLTRDVQALSDHASFVSNKIAFLLDATLGLINIEQNNIIKIFSVAAVVFLPPTLIASIYGMNFRHMAELEWPYGYPFALALMVVSAILPYVYFKRRGWL
jgi:magnesium transporter